MVESQGFGRYFGEPLVRSWLHLFNRTSKEGKEGQTQTNL